MRGVMEFMAVGGGQEGVLMLSVCVRRIWRICVFAFVSFPFVSVVSVSFPFVSDCASSLCAPWGSLRLLIDLSSVRCNS